MKKILLLATMLTVLSLNIAVAVDIPLPDPSQRPDATYRLFRTANVWTFIKLNTQDGRMWLVVYDIQGSNQGTHILNAKPFVDSGKLIPGRFTLYPTTNIYNLILLDQVDGKTWQVQWATDPKNRIIIPITGVDE